MTIPIPHGTDFQCGDCKAVFSSIHQCKATGSIWVAMRHGMPTSMPTPTKIPDSSTWDPIDGVGAFAWPGLPSPDTSPALPPGRALEAHARALWGHVATGHPEGSRPWWVSCVEWSAFLSRARIRPDRPKWATH